MLAMRGLYAVPSHGLVVYTNTLNRARSCIPNTFCIRCDSGWLLLAGEVEHEVEREVEREVESETDTDTENENGARSARVDRERPEGEGEGAPT